MYVGWSAGVLGVVLASRSYWMLAGWAVAVAAVHREVQAEEARLEFRFGAAYTAYRDRVPRYVTRRR